MKYTARENGPSVITCSSHYSSGVPRHSRDGVYSILEADVTPVLRSQRIIAGSGNLCSGTDRVGSGGDPKSDYRSLDLA